MKVNISVMPYGQWWRRHKRAFWQHFHPAAITSYQPIQRSSAHRFLNKLLKTPSKLREHIRLSVSTRVVREFHVLTERAVSARSLRRL